MKKLLLLIGGHSCDYLADMIWISLITNKKLSCTSNIYPSFFFSKKNLDIAWGKGFTLYGKLSPKFIESSPSSEEIKLLIKKNYYDYIIYPSIRRFDRFLGIASKYMGQNRIIAIDGEDDKNISWHSRYTTYYKRELTYKAYENGIKPISFFLPEIIIEDINSQINHRFNKKFFLAPCNPRDKKTYIYKDEKTYYQQYKDSYFGFTMLKGGWDCLRHYEIIASGSLPYFSNFEKVPDHTLKIYPRDLQNKANNLYKSYLNKDLIDKSFIKNYNKINLDFQKWLIHTAGNFGSEELKYHIKKGLNNTTNHKITKILIIKINFCGLIEYINERKNININKKKYFLNFLKFNLINLLFDYLYTFIRTKRE